MSHTPRVSIVLPTYNGQRFLALALDSICAQTFTDWELIIVDDCSTDDTPQIIAEYAKRDTRIKPHRNAHNLKLPGSLNAGFELARGAYLTWTSDDNLYRPEALMTLVTALDTHTAVDIVYTAMAYIDDDGQPTGARFNALPPRALMKKACVGASFLYRYQVHQALQGYDQTLFLAEDYDFWLRASAQFKLMPIDQVLYDYRLHAGTLTATKREAVLRAREQALMRALPTLNWTTRTDRAEAYLSLVQAMRELGDAQASRRYLRSALREAPLLVIRRWIKAGLQAQLGEDLWARIKQMYQRFRQ